MSSQETILAYYASAQRFTEPGNFKAQVDDLPADVGELVQVVQGLSIYDVVAFDFYDVELSEDQAAHIHLRPVADMLDALVAIDGRPLSEPRVAQDRLGCRCHVYTKLLVAFLRAKNIPARARCGFATYLHPQGYEDHWVCEYWHANEQRWVLVDAQLDAVWREKLNIEWNKLDISRELFLVAGDAWLRCRNGEADPEQFGISFYEGLQGLWFIAGDLVRDVAALNKVEMLPWDVWGCMPQAGTAISEEQLVFFDHLARLTQSPDAEFDELRRLYNSDTGLRVPEEVFNLMRQQSEKVFATSSD